MTAKAILVVEPEPEIGALLDAVLSEEGYAVTTAESLSEALAVLATSHFDLILTEALGQSRRAGFNPSFLATLRSRAGDTPIVLSSTYAATGEVHHGEHGLADLVPKPYELDELVRKVKRVLEEPGLQGDHRPPPR